MHYYCYANLGVVDKLLVKSSCNVMTEQSADQSLASVALMQVNLVSVLFKDMKRTKFEQY